MGFKLKITHQFIIVWLSVSAFLHNILMNGANNVIISSLQKEFYLSSRETGIYVSVYDVGSLLSSIFVSFASARGSKPRWISFGMIMLFIGCMICITPHFIRDKAVGSSTSTGGATMSDGLQMPITDENSIELCNKSMFYDVTGRAHYVNRSRADLFTSKRAARTAAEYGFFDWLIQYKHLLYVGNFVNGLSSASMTTITFSYLEDIAPPSLSAVYESAYYATGAFGVGVGFMITSKFLSIHTDIDKKTDLPSWLKPSHPNWIGAWWLPFLAFGFSALILALVIFIFPRKIHHPPKSKKNAGDVLKKPIEVELKSLTANGNSNGNGNGTLTGGEEQTRDYEQTNGLLEATRELGSVLSVNTLGTKSHFQDQQPASTLDGDNEKLTLIQKSVLLFRRPVYLFVIIAQAIEGLLQNSFLAFATLFLEYQYRLASGSASLILGLLSIPPLMIGGILSGLIVKRLKNRVSSCFKLLACILFVNLFVYAGFMVFCREANMISDRPLGISKSNNNNNNTVFRTSTDCSCNTKIFKPVCLKNSEDIFFKSACLAGCSNFQKENDTYYECSQVDEDAYFINGLCASESCTFRLVISFTCIALLMFLNALTFLPYLKVTIGCVNSREMNSIGLGFKQFFMNAFGTIPGPILFGTIIDTTCKYWHTDVNDQRVCKIYNNQQFAFAFGLLGVGFKSICFLLIIASIFVSRKMTFAKH